MFNCAAWTDVDRAEAHEEDATRVNAEGARNVAEAAGKVVYVSTDYVFDGRKQAPYVESDPPSPLSAYGRSKLEGELITRGGEPPPLRGPFVVAVRHRRSQLRGDHAPARREPEVRVVDDQVGCPTFTGHLAEALVRLAATEDYGLHHMAASGSCSWFEFAREIFARAGVDTHVSPCTTDDFPRPAPRPAWSVLESERGHRLPHWREGLDTYFGVRV